MRLALIIAQALVSIATCIVAWRMYRATRAFREELERIFKTKGGHP